MIFFDDLSTVSVAELKSAENWQAQYRLIMQWGALIQHKEGIRNEENLLRGCETSAWLRCEYRDGCNRFAFDSESRVIKGLAALLISQVDMRAATEIDLEKFKNLLAEAGLQRHLTPSRNNGIQTIISRIQESII